MRWPQRTPTERLLAHLVITDNPDDCWDWTGLATAQGYGKIFFDGRYHLAHRVAWMIHHGRVPDGLSVLHTCDRPSCCNHRHLWLGTTADNNRDRDRKGRGGDRRGVKNGRTKLTPAQARAIREAQGYRITGQLARQYGIGYSQVRRIRDRQAWAHV